MGFQQMRWHAKWILMARSSDESSDQPDWQPANSLADKNCPTAWCLFRQLTSIALRSDLPREFKQCSGSGREEARSQWITKVLNYDVGKDWGDLRAEPSPFERLPI